MGKTTNLNRLVSRISAINNMVVRSNCDLNPIGGESVEEITN